MSPHSLSDPGLVLDRASFVRLEDVRWLKDQASSTSLAALVAFSVFRAT